MATFLRYQSLGYGSAEYYYHFAVGYLFPALNWMMRNRDLGPFYMGNCGPKMTPLIHEAAQLLELEIEVVERHAKPGRAERVDVPRWDVSLLADKFVTPPKDSAPEFLAVAERIRIKRPKYFAALANPGLTANLSAEIHRFRNTMWDVAGKTPSPHAGKALVIEREAPPNFYRRNGGSESATYGTDRRSLKNVPALVDRLNESDLPATLFTPGAHGLAKQIRAFRDCTGLVLMRGAEIANALFMSPQSPIFVLCPRGFASYPAPHNAIAPLMNLSLTEERVMRMHCRAPTNKVIDTLKAAQEQTRT